MFTDISQIVLPVGRITSNGVELLGTAFLINKNGFLATAAHVVGNDDTGLVIITSKHASIQEYQDTTDNSIQYIPTRISHINPIYDVCVLKIDYPISSRIELASADEICVGDEVFVFGYPHSNHGRMVLTQQNTHIGAKVLIDTAGLKSKNLILNIQARPGQSGGPVISKSTMKIVAMILGSYAPKSNGGINLGGIDPQTLHQTTHAISVEYIKEMIK